MHKHIFYFQVLGNYSGLSTYHMSAQKGKPRKNFSNTFKVYFAEILPLI